MVVSQKRCQHYWEPLYRDVTRYYETPPERRPIAVCIGCGLRMFDPLESFTVDAGEK